MGLETARFIGELNSTNPTGTDPKSKGDDHLRMIKLACLNSFPGVAGIVTAYGTEVQGASVNEYVVTTSAAIVDYTVGMILMFKSTHTNDGACTVNVSGKGARDIVNVDGNAMSSGDIIIGSVVEAVYDGTKFYLLSDNDKASRDGETYTGAQDFTAATITAATQTTGDNTNKVATTAFVTSTALSSSLPSQGGNAGKVIKTDGTNASWELAIPSQSGKSGLSLVTDGASESWGLSSVDSLYLAQNFQ